MGESSSADDGTNRTVSRRSFLKVVAAALSIGVAGGAFSERATAQSTVFSGTAATNIESLDPTTGQSLGAQSFQLPVSVIVGPPRSAGGITEGNPFSLNVAPGDAGAAGAIELWSSLPAEDTLFQYWSLQADETGTQFQGQLTDSHVAEAIALNLVNAPTQIAPGIPPLPFPKAMVEGTALQGSTDGQSVQLVVQGNTIDGTTPFASQIQATRQ